jgi:hypothetical protein
MAKQQRNRKVNLGSTSSQHRSAANAAIAEAQSQIRALETSKPSCVRFHHGVVAAERKLAIAVTQLREVGVAIKHTRGRSQRLRHQGSALWALQDRLKVISEKFEIACLREDLRETRR